MKQTQNSKQGYFSLWLISCITVVINLAIFLLHHNIGVPLMQREEMYSYVTGPILNIPHFLQFCFILLFLTGFGAIVAVCRWQKAPFILFLLGTSVLLIMFLLYAIPQGIIDLYQVDFVLWNGIYLADRTLFIFPSILLLASFLIISICSILPLGKIWLQRYLPV